MFKVALVDDNPSIHSIIRKLLNDSFAVHKFELKSYYSAEDLLEDYSNSHFSFLLLDIEMPETNGIELSEKLQFLNHKIPIIFLTSYEHYMKDAFGLNVHSYILKDNMIEELLSVIRKLLVTLEVIENRIQVSFNTDMGNIKLYEEDIVCVYFEDRRPTIYTKKIKVRVYGEALYSVYEKLSSDMFLQPNSGIIVNLKYIKTIQDMIIYLNFFPFPITISRSKIRVIKSKYTEFLARGDSL